MATCIVTMLVADQITKKYAEPGDTTMRAMPFSEIIDDESKKNITLFHSNQQVGATIFMLLNIDSAFSPMFAIQIAAFLMTLVRKNIIMPNTWHLLYSWALMINMFLFCSFNTKQLCIAPASIYTFRYLRFNKRLNKYFVWIIIFVNIIIVDNLNILDYKFPEYLTMSIIICYLMKNVYKTRALYILIIISIMIIGHVAFKEHSILYNRVISYFYLWPQPVNLYCYTNNTNYCCLKTTKNLSIWLNLWERLKIWLKG
jgi:hypothetical protein